jgi:hypothetical protein
MPEPPRKAKRILALALKGKQAPEIARELGDVNVEYVRRVLRLHAGLLKADVMLQIRDMVAECLVLLRKNDRTLPSTIKKRAPQLSELASDPEAADEMLNL